MLADQRRYAEVAREHKRLSGAAELARRWRELSAQQDEAAELAADGDAEMRAFAQEQIAEARAALPEIEEELRLAMVERDPADDKDVIVELRAGTGGDEAALFAGDLHQMLTRYAEQHGFKTETLTASGGDAGGFKELVFEIRGDGAYSLFKHESGVHRVQRVPADRVPGPHPHLDGHRRGAARGGGRRRRGRPERPADRRLPGGRPRRPVGQHDRLGRADHPHPDAAPSSRARTSARSSRTRSGR